MEPENGAPQAPEQAAPPKRPAWQPRDPRAFDNREARRRYLDTKAGRKELGAPLRACLAQLQDDERTVLVCATSPARRCGRSTRVASCPARRQTV